MMKTLSAEESKTLYALLKSEQTPFDEIASDFNSKFPHARHFVSCSSLVLLLQAIPFSLSFFFVLLIRVRVS
jgi:hypothetical protein